MRRIIAVLTLAFLVTTAILSLTKEVVIRHWVREAFKQQLNLQVKTQEIYISLFRPRLTFEGFYILNPAGFGDQWLANAADVIVDYELSDLFRWKFKINKMKLDLLEINIVKNAKGEINLNSIEEPKDLRSKSPDLFIATLDLAIRRVTYQDLAAGVPVKVYDLNLKDLEFQNIEDLSGLSRLIAVKVLERIGLGQLGMTSADLPTGSKSVNPILKAGSFLEEVVRSLRQALPA